jgi:hypothetical protein
MGYTWAVVGVGRARGDRCGRNGVALLVLVLLSMAGCGRRDAGAPGATDGGGRSGPLPRWAQLKPPGEGEVLALFPQQATILPRAAALEAGLLVVDLSDGWAPFIFSESSEEEPGTPEGSGTDAGSTDAGRLDAGAPEAATPDAHPADADTDASTGDAAPDAPLVKPNPYRKTFINLANDRIDPDDLATSGPTRALDLSPEAAEPRRRDGRKPGKPEPPLGRSAAARGKRAEPVRNYLEPFGIPPTLSVLLRRIEEDAAAAACFAALDTAGLRAFDGLVTYQNARQARREYDEVADDAAWLAARLTDLGEPGPDAGDPPPFGPRLPDAGPVPWADLQLAPPPRERLDRLRASARDDARLTRLLRGQVRLRAVRAAQARLACEGLLTPRSRHVEGMFDLPTHEALAQWERKNDIFGWGFLGEQTLTWLQRPPLALHFETFKRVLTERVADAAGIIEDGTADTRGRPARYPGPDGALVPVPDTIDQHLQALLKALQIDSSQDMALFLRTFGPAGLRGLHVAFLPPPLPPYYAPHMDLQVEIDRGDIWYDFPFSARGQPVEQKRERYPTLTLFTTWQGRRVPLARWRTTIGSWRSELHPGGEIYFRYKNSDVGPRIWKQIVAAPVWVPPDSTPARDLLTRKIFDIREGPVDVVNTDVMGPGFQSAYGLVMAIHHKVVGRGGLFDNQIRTHGSVDYTSIARRFSHGCHRLVNVRAVRLFGFLLRHRTHLRQGDNRLHIKKLFSVEDRRYGYELTTRGYYYELRPPLPVNVLEGRILGTLKKPILTYVRKPGVIYQESLAGQDPGPTAEGAVDPRPTLGP